MKTRNNTFKIVMTALMMCLIMVATMFIRIPIPGTQGYVHLGDAMIFLSVLILGWKYGALAAAFGSMLADIIGGFAMWAPWSFAIKGIMALILGLIVMKFAGGGESSGKRFMGVEIAAMVIAGAFMAAAYYVAEGVMYGNWLAPILGVPWNIGQFVAGMVISVLISTALCKTPARTYFTYSQKPVTMK